MSAQHDLFPEAARLTDARGEYARTPGWLIEAGLRLVPRAGDPEAVLDLGAGLGDLALACWRRWPSIRVTAVEREPDRCEEMKRRFPAWDVLGRDAEEWAAGVASLPRRYRWPLVVMNPPFSRVIEWVLLALPLVAPRGSLLAIYPLEHLGGQAHYADLYRGQPPAVVGISPKRPQGQGWSDARAIICAAWAKDSTGALVGDTELEWMEVRT